MANTGALFDIPKLAIESQFCKTSFQNSDPKGLSPSKRNLHFFPCTFVISMFYPIFLGILFCFENLVWKVHTGLYLAASQTDWASSQGNLSLGVPAVNSPCHYFNLPFVYLYKGFHFLRLF